MADEDQPITEEIAINQHIIPFEGDDLAAAQSESGEIYVSLPGMCAALGLNVRGQVQRIQRTKSLAKGLRIIKLKTPTRGNQPFNCLRLDRIALWIAGLETERLKPEYQAKIEAYQDELAPVATRVFMRVMGVSTPISSDPRLGALVEQYDTLMAAATFIADHMRDLAAMPDQLTQAVQLLESIANDVQQLKQEKAISPAQKLYISEAVQRIVTDSAGKPGEMKQGQIYASMYRRFQVSGYGEIPAVRYEEVMSFLRDLWKRATSGTMPEQKNLF